MLRRVGAPPPQAGRRAASARRALLTSWLVLRWACGGQVDRPRQSPFALSTAARKGPTRLDRLRQFRVRGALASMVVHGRRPRSPLSHGTASICPDASGSRRRLVAAARIAARHWPCPSILQLCCSRPWTARATVPRTFARRASCLAVPLGTAWVISECSDMRGGSTVVPVASRPSYPWVTEMPDVRGDQQRLGGVPRRPCETDARSVARPLSDRDDRTATIVSVSACPLVASPYPYPRPRRYRGHGGRQPVRRGWVPDPSTRWRKC